MSRGTAILRSRWLGFAVSAGTLALLVLHVRGQFGDLSLSALPPAWTILLVVVLNAVANVVLALTWRRLVAVAGAQLGVPTAVRVWGLSQLARYGIGSAQILGRAGAGKVHGLPVTVSVVTTLVEIGWQFSLTVALALATLPWWGGEAPALQSVALLGLVPLLVLVAATAAPGWLLSSIGALLAPLLRRRIDGRFAERLQGLSMPRATSLRLSASYALNSALRLTAFLLLVRAFGGDVGAQLLRFLGAYAAGQVAGRVAVLAPGGIGPREAVTVLILSPAVGAGPALLVVTASRLLEIAAEAAFFVVSALWPARGAGPAPRPLLDAPPPAGSGRSPES